MPDGESTVLYRRVPRGLGRSVLREFAERLRAEVSGGKSFVCLVADDHELRRLNREFLKHDYATDVLSFPEPGPEGLGEIAISADRAAAQAAERGHTIEQEIEILMLHGLLHLVGMDHEADRGAMRRAETKWRKALGLPGGLIERAGA